MNIVLSADDSMIIVWEVNNVISGELYNGSNIVCVYLLNLVDDFTLKQRLWEKEKGVLFTLALDLLRSSNLLILAAPYVSSKSNKEGFIYLHHCNETHKYDRFSKFDGACSFECL